MIGKTVSHYRILEQLGAGGMGVVYKAEDLTLRRTVALKFLGAELSTNTLAQKRFIAEARTASSLDHPNIGTIFEINNTPDGSTFIAMAYYGGGTLEERIAEGPLDVSLTADIVRQVARGLGKAHEHGIVHRDVKPANIMFTDDGVAKILDFGLAKLAGKSRLTKAGTTVGTIAYMSPEQARGEEVDHRTDIWAVGVVMYEMLVKRLPFDDEYEAAMLYSILNAEPKRLTDLRHDLPADADRIITRCLQKEPDSRYQSMRELLEDMERSVWLDQAGDSKQAEARSGLPSIAVLPFRDMSPSRDQEYFCEGIAEELTNVLAHLEGLRVAARTSAFRYKDAAMDVRQIGRELGVESILEGSVRKSGSRLRVTAQLVNVSEGYHVWSEKFDRDEDDIFAIQDEISGAIAEALRVRIGGNKRPLVAERHTRDPEAYRLYLQGRHCWNSRHQGVLPKGIGYFRKAIDLDPGYALAYTGLADSYSVSGYFGYEEPNLAFSRAKAAAEKALDLAPELAEAWVSLGYVHHHNEWDWAKAEANYKRAIEIDAAYSVAHQWYGIYLASRGRHEEACRSMRKARELDPLSPVINCACGWLRHLAGAADEAFRELNDALDLDPRFPWLRYVLGEVNEHASRFDEAAAHFQEAVEITNRSAFYLAGLGHCLARSGRLDDARRILNELETARQSRYVSALDMALIFAGMRDTSELVAWLGKALEERAATLAYAAVDPRFAFARDDPGFSKVLGQMGPRR